MHDSSFEGLPLRWTVRRRLSAIVDYIWGVEEFTRSDIMAEVEISLPQASSDLRQIKAVLPDLFFYNASRKAFVVNRIGS